MTMAVSAAIFYLVIIVFIGASSVLPQNETIFDVDRQPKVSGRIVKLYSGNRPEPIHCIKEGFQPDKNDCSVFYRCVNSGRGKYTVFRFQCGPGTIYDPETEVCNHPKSTKRSECINTQFNINPHINNLESNENDIDSALELSPPFPINVNLQLQNEGTTKREQTTSSAFTWVSSTSTEPQKLLTTTKTINFVTSTEKSKKLEDICVSDGFIGDSENCRKFYRCVANGRGGFIRYEFSCSESTIWDDDSQSCNHAWAVKRRRCGRGSDEIEDTHNMNESSKVPMKKLSQNSPLPDIDSNKLQSKLTSPSKQKFMNFNNSTLPERFINNVIRQSYGNEDINNHENGDNVIQSTEAVSTTTIKATTSAATTIENNPDSTICTSNGFIGDNNDCKKFYRCVDDGKGGYTKFEFTCGDGTLWDVNTEACNHAWAVKNCKEGSQTSATTIHATESSTNTQSTTKTSTTTELDEVNESGYNNDQQPLTSTTHKVPETTLSQSSTSTQSDVTCQNSGFIGDKNNCKKFYRCVDNGNGSYTKYEFTCGDGTVWDPKIEACNHDWAVENCKEGFQTSAATVQTTESTTNAQSTPSTPELEEVDDSGYNNAEQPSISTTQKVPETILSQSGNITEADVTCKKSGFVGDKNNCKKFYRCVDNGNGSYTKYEFTCGDGTVWDPKIEACNHDWAVENCGETNDINKVTSTSTEQTNSQTQQTTQNLPSSSEPALDDDDDVGYGSQNPTSTTDKIKQPNDNDSNSNVCTSNGFVGDKDDCKKFYRCVDDGNGGYTRFEFTCGEGTVWDSELESCNHNWAVKECSNKESKSTTKITTIQETTTSVESSVTVQSSQYTSTSTSQKPNSDNQICTKEGFIGDNSNCKTFYRCVDNQHGSFIKYEFSCGEGTVWDSENQACNHPSPNNKCSGMEETSQELPHEHENDEIDDTTSNSQIKTSVATDKPQEEENKCKSEGFYGYNENCKIFYRCVDNGDGSYTIYDFSCGDGTVWDQELQGCNHEGTHSNCSKTSVTTPDSKTENETTTESHVSKTTKITQVTSSSNNDEDKCESEGFYANNRDCNKFYRCVSDGKGGYTKYDFSCGEGTMWVQEIQACDHDNGISNCDHSNTSYQSSTTASHITHALETDHEDDEYASENSNNSSTYKPSDGKCASEGFYANENDCSKFYRCVDNGNGGYTKYDFTCGEGTAWDSEIQGCNHENQVDSCKNSNQAHEQNQEENQTQSNQFQQPNQEETTSQSSQLTTGSTTSSSDGTTQSSSGKCEQEGYFGDSKDCKKFYRCVDNGKEGYTKYDFTCGEGTIWDPDVTTCNHPEDVTNPSCNKDGQNENSVTTSSSTTSSTQSSQSSSTTEAKPGTTSQSSEGSSDCSQESTTKKSSNNSITCKKEGFYANPDDCKKFYRCVDWDGDGKRFSVFHFDCGEGTIWDPDLETCNYEESIYPPRDCSGKETAGHSPATENSNEESTTQENDTTTTEKSTTSQSTTEKEKTTTQESTIDETTSTTTESTTEKSTTTTEQSTTDKSTTQQQTTKQSTTEKSTTEHSTTEQSTTEKSTTEKSTTEQSTTEQSTTEQSTTEQSTTEKSTTEQSTTKQSTTEQSTTEKSTTKQSTTEQSTTEQSTTEQSTTEQSTIEQSTTEQSTTEQSTTEQSTTEQSTTEQSTTEQSTTEQSTTEQSTTEQSTTEQSTTEQSTTEQSTTEQSTTEQSTTEQSTTEQSTTESSQSSDKECPKTEDDQYLYVCPTGFKRHPKYCNLFYQCTEDDDNHEVKMAVFHCPNNTIYDESKTQCVDEKDADKKCDGEMAERRRFKRLDTNYKSPIVVSRSKRNCPAVGHYPFEKTDECSPAFLKCLSAKSGVIRGYVYRCPENHVYWSVSRRCEPAFKIKNCNNIDKSWNSRWEIPLETTNISF